MSTPMQVSDLYLMDEENKPDVGGQSLMIEKIVDEYVVLNTSDICVYESDPIQSTSVFYLTFYILLLGVTQILSKLLMGTFHISPFEILIVRGGSGIIFHLAYLWYYDISLFDVEGSKARKVLSGAFIGFLSLLGHFVALENLSLGTALAIEYTSYHFATFFDSILFVFVIRCFQLIGYFAASLGVIALLFENHEESLRLPMGILAGLGGSFLSGVYSVFSRQTIAKVNPVLCMVYTDFIAACFAPAFAFITLDTNANSYTLSVIVLLALVGVCGWASNIALARSIKEEKILARPYMFRYVLVGVGFLVDIWTGELTILSFCGMVLVGVQFGLLMLQ